jgi:putative ATP-dependent endonuclease of the OLD family
VPAEANEQQRGGYDKFIATYPDISTNSQIKTLPEHSLEEYYPAPWKKSADEVKNMKLGTKTALAEEVGKAISQEQFQTDMQVVYSALQSAWSNAHQ